MTGTAGTLGSGSAEGAGLGADVHTFARPDQIRVTRVELDLRVDFKKKVLQGSATLAIKREPGCPSDAPLVLDTRGLEVSQIFGADGDKGVLEYAFGEADPILGRSLNVKVGEDTRALTIEYATTANASALQWIEPQGTTGGKQPFLFTQSEAIHARSWIPLQDSPGVRVSYGAKIRVPAGLTALMSADREGVTEGPGEERVFAFAMAESIPPYLIALAVGDLAFRPLGPRTGVFAEPEVVERAAREFVDTESMVTAVEKRFGPYRWGRYDLLVLPPSFPFGGMENPKLTFATPTILAGDRSLVALVAHELAHSWSGNLVTNATWRDFWLNEGFTTYLERRIMEDLYGSGRAEMERVLGLRELKKEIAEFPKRDQVLHVDLNGRDPDDGMTRIPYEKGALFLSTLEWAVGREKFDAFLRGYFDHFAFKSITTDEFVVYLRKNLFSDEGLAKSINLHEWLEDPGLPAGAPGASSERLTKVAKEADDWAKGKASADRLNTKDWSTQEWICFLQSLPEHLPAARLAELDEEFQFTGRGNAEVVQQWLVLAIKNDYGAANGRLESFLTTIGRRKFLMPLYAELLKTSQGKARAKAIYGKARSFYHPIAVESVDKLMKASDGK